MRIHKSRTIGVRRMKGVGDEDFGTVFGGEEARNYNTKMNSCMKIKEAYHEGRGLKFDSWKRLV